MTSRITTFILGALAVVAFAADCASASTFPAYNVTLLPQMTGTGSFTFNGNFGDAMSSSGNYVAGMAIYGNRASYSDMGFCYNGSAVNPLTPINQNNGNSTWYWTPAPVPLTIGNQPLAVNDSGTVVGQYNGQACYSTLGSTTPTPIPGAASGAFAYGINDSGVIVGDNDYGYTGYMYNMNTNTLTPLSFSALGINSAGAIVGCEGGGAETSESGTAVWRDAGGTLHLIPSMQQANAIDSTGTYVAGIIGIDSNGSPIPGVYDTQTGATVAIPNDNCGNACAYSVNKYGVAVGTFGGGPPTPPTQSYVYSDAFIYANGTTQYIGDLTLNGAPSNIIWTIATAINDAGDILVQGSVGTSDSIPETFLLTPVPTPEPSALLLAVAGMLGLAAYAWRKRR